RTGVCFESRADAADQRGGLLRDGRCCHGRSCIRGDEARNEPSHVAAGVGGFYWAGCLRGHHARIARRLGGPEISRVPVAEEICRGRMAGTEVGARVLHVSHIKDRPTGERKAKKNVCFLFAIVVPWASLFSTGAPCTVFQAVFYAVWNVRDSKRSFPRRASGAGTFPGCGN